MPKIFPRTGTGMLAEKLVLKRNQREADMSMQNIKERLEV